MCSHSGPVYQTSLKRLQLRTSDLTCMFLGTVWTWPLKIFLTTGICKNSLGGDIHSHERHLVFHVLQKSRTDASNFDRQFTSEQPTLTPVDAAVIDNITQDEFRGFSFVNDDYGKPSASVCACDVQSTGNVNGTSVREWLDWIHLSLSALLIVICVESMVAAQLIWPSFVCSARVQNKKAQLSLTNPRDACEKFARFT